MKVTRVTISKILKFQIGQESMGWSKDLTAR
jgi:hypothetical protein